MHSSGASSTCELTYRSEGGQRFPVQPRGMSNLNRLQPLSRRSLLFAALAAPAGSALAAEPKGDEWAQWRGLNGSGVGEKQKPPIEWSRTKNVAWSTKLPGV